MIHSFRCLVALVLLLPALQSIQAQEGRRTWGPEQVRQIDAFLETVRERFALPGISVALVLNEDDFFAEGYGLRSVASEQSVDRFTLFHMASVSKTFVSTALMQLVEQEVLDLDMQVAEALPDGFQLADPRAAEITLRQLLTHTSGMPDTDDYGWDRPRYDDEALGEYIGSLGDLKLQDKPGASWSYSNIAYEVLGHVVAAASGETFESYLHEHVLSPLGMNDSGFLKQVLDPAKLSAPHIGPGRPLLSPIYPYNREHAPSSTLHSSAVDMARYIRALLAGGVLDGHRVLEQETVEEMWRQQFDRGPGRDAMAHGWFTVQSRIGRLVLHGGNDVGFRSHLMLAPERKLGVAVMSNHERAPVSIIARELLYFAAGSRELSDADLRRPLGLALEPVRLAQGISRALTHYDLLREEQPDAYNYDGDALVDYALRLVELGATGDAVLTMEKLVATMPAHHLAHRYLAHMLLKDGRLEDARRSIARSLAIEPGHVPSIQLARQIEAALARR